MIPRIAHYCWFGGATKPPLVRHCIDSWKRFMPDWQIKEWNEKNFNPRENRYAHEAYKQKKWAFVTDYMRLRALYWEGGIYMDGDVEVVKPLDEFLWHRAFTGHETPELLVTATMGAEAGHPWIKMLLDYYDNAVFDGRTTNTQVITRMSTPLIQAKVNGYTYLSDGVVIYPVDFFCPFNHQELRPTPNHNTHAIHHFAGSWTPRGKANVR